MGTNQSEQILAAGRAENIDPRAASLPITVFVTND